MGAELPRLLVTAPGSGGGKTTVAIGIMAALRARGLAVAPFKTGPDYIDPGYHALASGRPGRNLDPHLCGEELMVPLLLHGATTPTPADIAVIEGAMGLFDGRLGKEPVGRAGYASAAHVAALTRTPSVLVLDAGHSVRTLAAVAQGIAGFDPAVRVAGVVLNRVGGERHARECRAAVEDAGIAVFGALPRDGSLATPSRHLGLVPAGEQDEAAGVVTAAGELIARHVDLDRLLQAAASAPSIDGEAWHPEAVVRPVAGRPLVAVAGGRAFTFRYAETTELLEAAGCRVVEFDPLRDAALPEGARGLWIGGGFPELHAEALAENATLRRQIRELVRAGLPTVAECAGLLYLCRSLDGHEMAGAVDVDARMSERLTLCYDRVTALADNPLLDAGESVPSHEFHRTVTELGALPPGWRVAWRTATGEEGLVGDPAGLGRPTALASYQHLHWAGMPGAASRFAALAAASDVVAGDGVAALAEGVAPEGERPGGARVAAVDRAADDESGELDLRHHGDRDVRPGLVDFAVNVRAECPPAWLQERLAASVARWGAYPDAREAREALAAAHGVDPSMVLPTAGAAEAFTLIARGRPSRRPLIVHPQFTEPEQALRTAGLVPERWILERDEGFRLMPERVPAGPDLVVVGNPTNPTGVLHPAEAVQALRRPGRVVVVDEAFMDAIPGERESVIGPDMDGLLVLRSLTKTWSLAGLRAGYVVGDAALIAELERQQPPWSVSTPAAEAMVACMSDAARAEAARMAEGLVGERAGLVAELESVGLATVPGEAPFVLVDTSSLGPTSLREPLIERGFAVRRGETFPGLGPTWIRLAVRDRERCRRLAEALAELRA